MRVTKDRFICPTTVREARALTILREVGLAAAMVILLCALAFVQLGGILH